MRLRAVISYDGTDFYGWQIQKDRPTIQSNLEAALEHVCRKAVRVTGAGRTDTGVHAIGQVAHFDWDHALPPDKLILGLNGLLPGAIRVNGLEPADPQFHARFDARSKIYLYRIDRGRFADPFHARFALHYPYPLDMQLLRECARIIEGQHDFSAFQATGTDVVTTTRTVSSVDIRDDIELLGTPLIYVRIHSNGFLRKMARFLVGTMLQIAGGRRPLSDLQEALRTGNRELCGTPAPARGLFLEQVFY